MVCLIHLYQLYCPCRPCGGVLEEVDPPPTLVQLICPCRSGGDVLEEVGPPATWVQVTLGGYGGADGCC